MMPGRYAISGFCKKIKFNFCCDITPFEKLNFSSFQVFKEPFSIPKMTTRSQQKKKAEIENPLTENSQNINPVAGTSKSPKVHNENLQEMKTTLRKEIMSDPTKILAKNQKKC